MFRLRSVGDNILTHKFPRDIAPGDEVCVEIGGIDSELLDSNGPVIRPSIRQSNQKRQERFTLLEMEFGQKITPHELQVNMRTSEVFLIGRIHSPLILTPQILTPRRWSLTTYYARKSKKKMLHAYFQHSGYPFIKIEHILDAYDRVLCVDTNTDMNQSGQKVAVTTALVAKARRLGEVAVRMGADQAVQLVVVDPPPGNPELHGIWSILLFLRKEHPNLLEGRIAVITDTEYGKVRAWYERTEPFYNGQKLPDGIDIFYATADAGSDEFMPNQLMKTCDSLSAIKLREVMNG